MTKIILIIVGFYALLATVCYFFGKKINTMPDDYDCPKEFQKFKTNKQ